MKIRATEEQGYFRLNGMSITTGNVYEGEPNTIGNAFIVVGDDGDKVILLEGEYELEDE